MPLDLRSQLPILLPGAIAWAESQATAASAVGAPLDATGVALARLVGVRRPDAVRVALIRALPLPQDEKLREAALQAGLLGPGMVGLTLGYSVLICRGHLSRRLLSHELRHVHQFERLGSIAAFLRVYLPQVVEFGYENAPFEIDARNHEVADA